MILQYAPISDLSEKQRVLPLRCPVYFPQFQVPQDEWKPSPSLAHDESFSNTEEHHDLRTSDLPPMDVGFCWLTHLLQSLN